jgi:hypothetical protein
LQQFKDKEGQVDTGKIQKANEHLERGIKEREELVRRNKELLSKFTKTSQELARTNKDLGGYGSNQPIQEGGQGQDVDSQRFLERLERVADDPLLFRELIREEARNANGDVRGAVEGMQKESAFSTRAQELNELVRAGHSWIVTEGLGRFEKVFEEKPFLLQSGTPYMDAMRFIDSPPNGSAPTTAQGGNSTPILGSGSAVPPPSSTPPATKERKMADLSQQLHEAFQYGEKDRAAKIMAEMNRLELGR